MSDANTPHRVFLEMLERAKVDHGETIIGARAIATSEPAAPSCGVVAVGWTEFHFDEAGELRFVLDTDCGEVLSHAVACDPCDRRA